MAIVARLISHPNRKINYTDEKIGEEERRDLAIGLYNCLNSPFTVLAFQDFPPTPPYHFHHSARILHAITISPSLRDARETS